MTAPPAAPLPPGVARRRELRQQRRRELLLNLWRLLVLSAMAGGLGYLLLRQGWTLSDPAQVEVVGSDLVNREQVIEAGQLRFPQPLLAIRPADLRGKLAAALPVEQVQIHRLMLPPRLRVELVDRQAVARAERRTAHGIEKGFIDSQGNWINMLQSQGMDNRRDLSMMVRGWNERHRPALVAVLAERDRFGSALSEIRFESDGSLWLTSSQLGPIRLGPVDARLERRLEVAEHLSRNLPAQLQGRRLVSIDLSDPEQPELNLPAPIASPQGAGPGSVPAATPATGTGAASAQAPTGGQ